MTSSLTRLGHRAAVTAAAALALIFAVAAPASAHVEATAPGAQAGAGPVTVAFFAEAESTTAGIVGVKTQLPAGVLPEWVSLASGPAGWTLAPTTDGYEVGGPDIGAGVDLEYGITIGQLPPDVTEVAFKTLLRYSDGREDAWIELPTPSNPAPEQPAPTIAVAPAPQPTATPPSSPSTATPDSTDNPSPAVTEDDAQSSSDNDTGWGSGTVAAVVVVVLAVLAGGVWFWRTRASRRV